MNTTSSPIVPAGKFIVIVPLVVFTKYPSPATAVKVEVFTACHDVPPDTSAKDNCPTPVAPEPVTLSTFKNLSAVTFPVGNLSV